MTRRAWGIATLSLVLVAVLSIVLLPDLSGVRGSAARALSSVGGALTIPPSPSPDVAPVVTPEQQASRAGSVMTATRLTEAEQALAEGREQDALAAYTGAVEAIAPVLPEDGREALGARAQQTYDVLVAIFDPAGPTSQPAPGQGEVRTS